LINFLGKFCRVQQVLTLFRNRMRRRMKVETTSRFQDTLLRIPPI
jgi:hypothetical protein